MCEGAGLEELEGLGRECGSPRKRTAHKFGTVGIPLSCPTGGGKGFVQLDRCRVSVIRGGVCQDVLMGIFHGWGGVVSLGLCARSRVSRTVHGASCAN